jgi:hypothetical protein
MLLIIPYSKTKGAATIVATPRPIRPKKKIKIISPRQNPTTVNPSSRLSGMINNPIAENENSNSHKVIKLHLSFQYMKATIKQQNINNR